jgi:hypothetical protein
MCMKYVALHWLRRVFAGRSLTLPYKSPTAACTKQAIGLMNLRSSEVDVFYDELISYYEELFLMHNSKAGGWETADIIAKRFPV